MDYKERLFKVINENADDQEMEITQDCNLISDLDFDSIKLIMYVIGVEQEFGVVVPDELLDFEHLGSVQMMCDYLESCFGGENEFKWTN